MVYIEGELTGGKGKCCADWCVKHWESAEKIGVPQKKGGDGEKVPPMRENIKKG
jgi:hypothetical protein